LDNRPGERPRTPAPRQAQPVPAVSGMGCGLCGSSRSRMAFNAWVWGDSDRGSKSISRRSAVIRTARSLSVRSSRCILPNMARKRSGGKARSPARPCERSRRSPRLRTSLKASISPPARYADQWGPGRDLVIPARVVGGRPARGGVAPVTEAGLLTSSGPPQEAFRAHFRDCDPCVSYTSYSQKLVTA
jgi:hypothetical protein